MLTSFCFTLQLNERRKSVEAKNKSGFAKNVKNVKQFHHGVLSKHILEFAWCSQKYLVANTRNVDFPKPLKKRREDAKIAKIGVHRQ